MPGEEPLTRSDAVLLARIAEGDEAAFGELLGRHEAAVLRYARALAPDAAAAEDALQETFLAAWRSASTYRGQASARGWLLAIARNAAFRQHRRRVGEPADTVPLDALGQDAGWGEDSDADFFDALARRDLVERGFAGLSPLDREVLVLRDLEGFSGDEAAALLGLGLPAVKSRLHRARLRFAANVRKVTHGTA